MAILATQTIIGNIGKVYEMRTVGKDNREVIDFSVAVTPRKQVDGEWTDGETYWVNITAWGRLAANIKDSFKQGDRVFIIGRTDMKPAYTHKTSGDEIPARPYVVAEFAGLEISNDPAQSDRVPGGRRGNDSSSSRSEAPAKKRSAAPAKKAPAKIEDDDLDFDFDDDDDDSGDTPF